MLGKQSNSKGVLVVSFQLSTPFEVDTLAPGLGNSPCLMVVLSVIAAMRDHIKLGPFQLCTFRKCHLPINTYTYSNLTSSFSSPSEDPSELSSSSSEGNTHSFLCPSSWRSPSSFLYSQGTWCGQPLAPWPLLTW
jgi:hypothetical protein